MVVLLWNFLLLGAIYLGKSLLSGQDICVNSRVYSLFWRRRYYYLSTEPALLINF